MTERQIQTSLYWRRRSACKVLMPNCTPSGWFECDMLAITNSGYLHEYEIKLTISDYKKDREKGPSRGWADGQYRNTPERTKHARLEDHDVRGPVCFWYVVPDGMIVVDAKPRTDPAACLPPWAGLMYAAPSQWGRIRLSVIRRAPRLHGQKLNPATASHILGNCYYRYWGERIRNDNLVSAQRLAAAESTA